MKELKNLLHELRCDIAAIPVTNDNKIEIENAYKTLEKAWNKISILSDTKKESLYCICSTPYPDTFGEKCRNCFKEIL